MTIPGFDRHGNLPPGEHAADWPEIEARYGYNGIRRGILVEMKDWLFHMKSVHCRTVYLDGSFVCAKPEPGDYDACWDATGVDGSRLDARLLDLTERGRREIKKAYGGDIRPDMVCPPGTIMPYVQMFQRDRNGRRKGIVRLDPRMFEP